MADQVTDQYAPMDFSSYLDSEEMIAEYLTAAAEDENPDVLLLALANVVKARGMAQVAKAAGLGRESLYKALAPGSHPRFETIAAVLRALNVRIEVAPQALYAPELADGLPASLRIKDISIFKRSKTAKGKPSQEVAPPNACLERTALRSAPTRRV